MVDRKTLLSCDANMRKNPTPAENKLWQILRKSQIDGYKFRRQVVIDYRIVDFFCPAKMLIIEIDGDTHDADQDTKMDEEFRMRNNYETMRFTNADIMQNIEGVYQEIEGKLALLPDRWPTTPNPSSKEEESLK